MTNSEQSVIGTTLARECIRLLLRVMRTGHRNGWTPELEAVWEQACVFARAADVPEATITEIRGGADADESKR